MENDVLDVTKKIQILTPDNFNALNLFLDFLVKKQKENGRVKNGVANKHKILSNLKFLDLPVDNYIVNREEIYDDRI